MVHRGERTEGPRERGPHAGMRQRRVVPGASRRERRRRRRDGCESTVERLGRGALVPKPTHRGGYDGRGMYRPWLIAARGDRAAARTARCALRGRRRRRRVHRRIRPSRQVPDPRRGRQGRDGQRGGHFNSRERRYYYRRHYSPDGGDGSDVRAAGVRAGAPRSRGMGSPVPAPRLDQPEDKNQPGERRLCRGVTERASRASWKSQDVWRGGVIGAPSRVPHR